MRINLVMSGGGTRLPAFVGAVMALHDLGAQIVRVGGVSGGSVVGAFLAAGFSPAKIGALAVETSYRQFIDISPLAILAGNGLCAGKRFERWLDGHLQGARFCDLQTELKIVATDVLEQRAITFSPATTPEVRVAEAVRCSMGIPGYFACRRWQGYVLVDGALAPGALWTMYEDTPDARTTYVLLAGTQSEPIPRRRVLWSWQYALGIVKTLMLALENGRVPGHLWNDTTLIKTGPLSGFDFRMTTAQKQALMEDAYLQVKTHLTAKSDLFGPRATEVTP